MLCDYSFSPQPPYRARSKAFSSSHSELCAYLRPYILHRWALTSPNPEVASRHANPSRIAGRTRCEPVDGRGRRYSVQIPLYFPGGWH
ncbi:hypothetical protein P691DRAFT_517180 [Macrolepiota fuliginosa MF-IS2]|uniref:Uncharacterized protein n=1 Tax=Macrolepiota fuliginosa MF-IS2 TaxID=1400762 RepID=A0A9P5WZR3_9AGAR|nr:hypothetical protein P691DRAFT_517180 [Macrolepiota fuliginosa MF-IS2]